MPGFALIVGRLRQWIIFFCFSVSCSPLLFSEWSLSTTSPGWLAMKAQEASSPFWGRSEYYFFFFPLPDLRALKNPIKRSSICWVYVSCEPALSVAAKFLIYMCACTRAFQPLPAKWRNDTPECSPGAPGVDVTVPWLSELLWFDLHLIHLSFLWCGLFSVASEWRWNLRPSWNDPLADECLFYSREDGEFNSWEDGLCRHPCWHFHLMKQELLNVLIWRRSEASVNAAVSTTLLSATKHNKSLCLWLSAV